MILRESWPPGLTWKVIFWPPPTSNRPHALCTVPNTNPIRPFKILIWTILLIVMNLKTILRQANHKNVLLSWTGLHLGHAWVSLFYGFVYHHRRSSHNNMTTTVGVISSLFHSAIGDSIWDNLHKLIVTHPLRPPGQWCVCTSYVSIADQTWRTHMFSSSVGNFRQRILVIFI